MKKSGNKVVFRSFFAVLTWIAVLAFVIAPSAYYLFNSSTETFFFNRTEVSNLGLRPFAPVLFMDFNSQNESTYVKDNSLYNNFGTLVNSPTYNATGGYDGGGAYQFDGTEKYVSVVDSDSLDMNNTGEVTISAWVKLRGSKRGPIVSKWYSGSNCGDGSIQSYTFEVTANNKLYFSLNSLSDGSDNSFTGSQAMNNNTWYHVVFTGRDGTNELKLYINGLMDSQFNKTGTGIYPTTTNIRIGSQYTSSCEPSNFFNGTIDNVQIFNRVLSAADVLCLYNGTGCSGKNNSLYVGKYSNAGDFKSLVFYNQNLTYWNVNLSIADTYSTATGIVTNKNEINLTNPNLVAYWALDGNYLDAKGRNNGTAVGGVNNATGISSRAMRFDGSSQFISLNNNTFNKNSSDSFSISAWFLGVGISGTRTIFGHINDADASESGKFGYQLVLSSTSNLEWYIGRSNVGWDKILTNATTNNVWHHSVAIYNNSNLYLYLDGVLINSGSIAVSSVFSSNHVTKIGGLKTNSIFNGSIDEVSFYNKSLSQLEVQQLYKSGLSQHANTNITVQTRMASSYNISDSSLLGLWAFNTYNFSDSKGSNNGIPQNGVKINKTSCKIGNCATFDGVNDSIIANSNLGITGNSNFTVSFWANTMAGQNTNDNFVGWGTGTTNLYRFGIGRGNDANNLMLNTHGTNPSVSLGGRFTEGVFNNILVTKNGTNITVYTNGLATGSTILSLNLQDSPIEIGSFYAGTIQFIHGSIDEVMIFNRSLSSSEIISLYGNQSTGAQSYLANDVGLVSYYKLDEDEILGSDSSNKSNQGGCSATGCPTLANSSIVGPAYYFDGSNDRVTTSSVVPLGQGNYSISAWIRLDGLGTAGNANPRIICPTSQGWYPFIYARGSDGTGKTGIGFWTGAKVSTPTYGQWHHYVAIHDPVNSYSWIYFDGVLNEARSIGAVTVSPQTFDFGSAGTEYFNGALDEIRIYNRSLSLGEIQNLYNLGSYHINWDNAGNYSIEQVVRDGINTLSSSSGKFMQYKTNFYTNDTNVASYLIRHNVTVTALSPPIVTLISPVNNNISINFTQIFYCNVSSPSSNITNVTLQIYNSTAILYSNITFLNNNSVNILRNYTFVNEGRYSWNCVAYNNQSLSATASSNYTLYITRVIPSVNFTNPTPINGTNTNLLNFSVNVSMNKNASVCRLFLNSTSIASGGTVTYDGAYAIHTFTTNGTFSVPFSSTAEVLVVAGGGGGGPNSNYRGAAGGAGGLIHIDSFPITTGSYNIIIGSGGPVGINGSDSYLIGNGRTLRANGGGKGGDGDSTNNGRAGGSGGGQWYPGYTGASSTQASTTNDGISTYPNTGFGNKGGDSSSSQPYGSGGGGAGAAGGNWNGPSGPVGGIGKAYSISGVSTYYAGGGGCAGYPLQGGYAGYSGGLGGGGTGNNNLNVHAAVQDGANNTGGGGGSGGNGGSGIVIIRYLSGVSSSYNMTLVNAENLTLANYTLTNLTTGTYNYYVVCNDLVDIVTSTENRSITLDVNSPNVTSGLPANNTYTNLNQINFSLNLSDDLGGIKNATLYVYNSTNLVYSNTTNSGINYNYTYLPVLNFNGINTKIQLNSFTSQNYTISGWFKYNTLPSDWNIIFGTGGVRMGLFLNSGGNLCHRHWPGSPSSETVCTSYSLQSGRWYFGTITRGADNIAKLYVNGILETQEAVTDLQYYGAATGIGWEGYYSTYFNGSMDDIMIFNRSLNSTEILSIYNNQSIGLRNSGLENDASLVSYYKFNELSGTIAVDSKGNNNATISGSPSWSINGRIISTTTYSQNFTFGTLAATISIPVTLVGNIYNWFIGLFDFAGNFFQSENKTLIVDTISPNATLIYPENNSVIGDVNANFTINISDNTGVKNATLTIVNASDNSTIATRIYGDASTVNHYLTFNGVDQQVQIDNPSFSMGTNSRSFCAWVKPNTNPSGFILNFGPGTNAYGGAECGFAVGTNGALSFWGAWADINSVDNVVPFNNWSSICFTYDSSSQTGTLYYSGQYVTSASVNLNTNSASSWYIGGVYISGWGSNQYYPGSIDEVRVYNRPLSLSEIIAINNSGRISNSSLTSSGLQAWYDFEDTAGITLGDRSGNNNNGTLVNSPVWQNETFGSYTPLSEGILQSTIGIVVSLVDGVYNWFYSLFDWAGNAFQTDIRNVSIDLPPVVTLVYPSAGVHNYQIHNLTCSASDRTGIQNITLYVWNDTDLVFKSNTYNLNGATSNESTWNFDLTDGNYIYNCLSHDTTLGAPGWSIRNYSVQIDDSNFVITGDFPTTIYYNYLYPRNLTFNITTTAVVKQNLTFELLSPGRDITSLASRSQTSGSCAGQNWGWSGVTSPSCDINVIADGDTNTYFGLRGNMESYILSDFGSTKLINSVKINWKQSPGYNPYPGNYYFQYYDGSNWISPSEWASNGGEQDFDSWHTFTLASPVSASAVRLYRPNTGRGSGIAIREMQVWGMEKITNSNNGYFSLLGPDTPSFEIAANSTTQINLPLSITSGSFSYNLYTNANRSRFGSLYTYASPIYGLNFVLEQTPPALVGTINSTPSQLDDLDPGTFIMLNATMADAGIGIDFAVFQSYYDGLWHNLSTAKIGNYANGGVYSANFTSSTDEKNYTVRLWSIDKLGNSGYTSNITIRSLWDCTWNLVTDVGANLQGWKENKQVGTMAYVNTGDPEFGNNNCTLVFRMQHNLDVGRIYFDNDLFNEFDKQHTTTFITAKTNLTIPMNATFIANSVTTEPFLINVNEVTARSTSPAVNISGNLVSTYGAYLDMQLTSPTNNSIVYLTPGNLTLNSYIKNMVDGTSDPQNKTAFNVQYNWSIPQAFIDRLILGNISHIYDQLNTTAKNYNNLTIEFNDANLATISEDIVNVSIESFGYENSSGNLTLIRHNGNNTLLRSDLNLILKCYPVVDGVVVSACWPTDPDTVYCGNGHIDDNETCSSCPADAGVCGTTAGLATGGAGGGSGGSAGGATVVKSEANYELLRGGKQNFQLEVKNKYGDEMKNIKILVSGLNSEYISISPDSIDSLAPGATRNVTITISAPGYFSGIKYTLVFDINANLVSNATSGATAQVTDKRFVTLYIVEVDRKDAVVNLNESYSLIEEMNKSGLIIKEVSALLADQNKAYTQLNFLDVKNIYEQIKKIRDNAFESKQLIEEITANIAESEKNGITITESKKSLYLAQVAFARGDYALALERLKEAKLVYALEVKGEYNLIYTIKNNPGKSFGIAIFAGLFGWGSSILIRLRLYKRRLKNLSEEETLLLELMKMVQRQCFEEKRMSMEEYDQAMMQYEAKLSETIEDKIRTETKIANLLKARGKRKALDQEKARLIELIRKVQDDYLNKNKIETRIYENMVKSYSGRLSEVDEQLAYVEAQDALKKQSKINGMFKV